MGINTQMNKGFTRTPNFGVSFQRKRGFTLVELIVSVSLFTVIMVLSMGSIISVFDANRKSESLRSVMDNLNFTLEAMTRTIRFGTVYHCDVTVTNPAIGLPNDCLSGAGSIIVTDTLGRRITYKLNGTRISRIIDTGTEYFLTSSDVTIRNMKFYIQGARPYSDASNIEQPRVLIVIDGFAGSKPITQTNFTLQTTVSQRVFDSQ